MILVDFDHTQPSLPQGFSAGFFFFGSLLFKSIKLGSFFGPDNISGGNFCSVDLLFC
jgi:hypothetical protein